MAEGKKNLASIIKNIESGNFSDLPIAIDMGKGNKFILKKGDKSNVIEVSVIRNGKLLQ